MIIIQLDPTPHDQPEANPTLARRGVARLCVILDAVLATYVLSAFLHYLHYLHLIQGMRARNRVSTRRGSCAFGFGEVSFGPIIRQLLHAMQKRSPWANLIR